MVFADDCEAGLTSLHFDAQHATFDSDTHGVFEVALRHNVVAETVEVLCSDPLVGADEGDEFGHTPCLVDDANRLEHFNH